MTQVIGRTANQLLGHLGLQIKWTRKLEMQQRERGFLRERLRWHEQVAREASAECIPRSQLGQDTFALHVSGFKSGGFFVEVGAASGVELSNTYLLEHAFGWTGILAEPASCWHASLRERRHCIVDHRCVWTVSGETVQFAEAPEGEYSRVANTPGGRDIHAERRIGSNLYNVETVTLDALLAEHEAPRRIDFLSIDTEGSEFEILRDFDFDRWEFAAITVEHNYDTVRRERIRDLLISNGYRRAYDDLTKFDDWYTRSPPT